MIRIWAHFFGVLTLLVVAHGVYTNAYFMDNEGSQSNVLAAVDLDSSLTGSGFHDTVCALGDTVETELFFTNVATYDFTYRFNVLNLSQNVGFCEDFQFTIARNGETIFTGSIEALALQPVALASGASDTYTLTAELPVTSPKIPDRTCQFDTSFSAYLKPLHVGEGFSEVETVTHTINGTAASGGGSVRVVVSNTATVTNAVHVSANTGGNSAAGGAGGAGGSGGAGGNGGAGGTGGSITTGNAVASATVTNEVNTNNVVVTTCGCTACGTPCTTTEETALAEPPAPREVRLVVVSSPPETAPADTENETASTDTDEEAIAPTTAPEPTVAEPTEPETTDEPEVEVTTDRARTETSRERDIAPRSRDRAIE